MYNWKIVLITILLLCTARFLDPKLIEQFRLNYFDSLQTLQEPILSENIVIVDIDETALEKYGQFPFSRDLYAKWLDSSPENNVYVFNMGFTEPDRFGKDSELEISMGSRDVILSSFTTNTKEGGEKPPRGFGKLGKGNPEDWLYPFKGIRNPVMSKFADGVGTVTVAPSVDGIVRESPLAIMANGHIYPSVALEILRVYEFQPNLAIKIKEAGVEWVRMGSLPPMATTPNANVQIAYWNQYERVSFGDPIPNDKIIILGLSAGGLVNPVATPTGAMLPHDIQAHLISTVVNNIYIDRPWYADQLEFLLIIVLTLTILLLVYKTPTTISALLSVSAIGGTLYYGYHLWMTKLMLLDVLYPSLSAVVVFAHASFNKYYVTFQLKEQIKKQFGTYLSPDLVKQLQDNPDMLVLGGERKEMTFLFMDICGFTPVSEHYKNKNDPEGLVTLINMYLDRMTKIILNNGGTIDKYMGDCIMAFWNAPVDCEDHATMAVKSAIEISGAADELIEELEKDGLPRIDIGIGINTGECIVGNMGSEVRFDYSVIGDAVNLASRLEGQTRNYDGVRVLLSRESAESSKVGEFTRVDSITVKGKSESIEVYTVD